MIHTHGKYDRIIRWDTSDLVDTPLVTEAAMMPVSSIENLIENCKLAIHIY
jgi:hypothetical protein